MKALKEYLHHFKNIETPFYFYDLDRLQLLLDTAVSESNKYKFHLHYAIKANANTRILELIKNKGIGIDCVSGQEVKAALDAGFEPEKIAFAGVGKSDWEINLGLDKNIFTFNVESLQELEVIESLASEKNCDARIALRINPDVQSNTHHYITTGLEENKFGIDPWQLEAVLNFINNSKCLKLTGIHFHIGSQITDLSSFKNLCLRVNYFQKWFIENHIIVEHINVGGGLGIDYSQPDKKLIPDFAGYFKVFDQFLELRPRQEVHFELGRALVAGAGDLISRVLYIKEGMKTNFAILDAGMTELIRPALYQAYHKIENLSNQDSANKKYDVVGPICESSDCFGKAVELPETNRGDLIAIRSTGAYGEVMASNYNLRPKAKALYSDELF